jgi:hypothetical protein
MQSAASSRSFGLLLAGVLAVLGALNYAAHEHAYGYWAAAAALFLMLAVMMPRVLAPLKRLWLRLGSVFHRLVGPPVLALTYVVAIVPVGLIVRLFGLDLLGLRRNASVHTYWRSRSGGPEPESLRDQF